MAKKQPTSNTGIHPIGANKDLYNIGWGKRSHVWWPVGATQLHLDSSIHHLRSSFAFITCLTRRLRKKNHGKSIGWNLTVHMSMANDPPPLTISLRNGEFMILYQINSGIQNDWPFKIFKMTQICRFCSPFLNRFCNIQIAMWTGHSGQTSETQDRYCLNYRVFLQMCIVSHENAV